MHTYACAEDDIRKKLFPGVTLRGLKWENKTYKLKGHSELAFKQYTVNYMHSMHIQRIWDISGMQTSQQHDVSFHNFHSGLGNRKNGNILFLRSQIT